MKTLQNTLALIIALLPLNSFARTYEITTPDEEVKCTIENLTESRTLREFDPEFRTLYMPILVKIENNSNSAITLKKEKYLSGLEKSLISKKKIFVEYNKKIKEANNLSFKSLITSLISTSAFIGSCYGIFYYKNSIWEPIFGITMPLSGLTAIISTILAIEFPKDSNQKLKHKRELLKKTALQKGGSSTKKTCNPKESIYTIEPGYIFYDILLVDLEEENRQILKQITPKLIYEKQSKIPNPAI